MNNPSPEVPSGILTDSDNHKKRRLIVATGGKGGTGTSMFSRLLLDFYTDHGRRVIAVDCKEERLTFFAYLKDEDTCKYCDLSKEDAFDNIGELCRDNELVLVDLPSGVYGRFENWVKGSDFAELQQVHGVRLTVVFLVTVDRETVTIVSRAVAALSSIAQVVAVENRRTAKDLPIYKEDPVSAILADQRAVMEMIDFGNAMVQKYLVIPRIRFRDAIQDDFMPEEPLVKYRVGVLWESTKTEFSRIKEHLF